eukprot:CAMPEP_0184368106 /NCGR_PEP_ID=MMETSP1089-20130417/161337_1 /TAXON_ID=38269 ORGANISM="Gloeochaete wittrockiana, Strain SAG46.84" /NCGR_SAMPLE_ID=MMETSP1089 /ASSEMBLY_ACC=CAM_ASM_000445 /LENGTH=469 /DNA_ID=CAMNT_0026710299 /DNA_START=260 /DNA_END=1669 /DNA_ORIENTATION=-
MASLDDGILLHTFSMLPCTEVVQTLSLVCKRFHGLVHGGISGWCINVNVIFLREEALFRSPPPVRSTLALKSKTRPPDEKAAPEPPFLTKLLSKAHNLHELHISKGGERILNTVLTQGFTDKLEVLDFDPSLVPLSLLIRFLGACPKLQVIKAIPVTSEDLLLALLHNVPSLRRLYAELRFVGISFNTRSMIRGLHRKLTHLKLFGTEATAVASDLLLSEMDRHIEFVHLASWKLDADHRSEKLPESLAHRLFSGVSELHLQGLNLREVDLLRPTPPSPSHALYRLELNSCVVSPALLEALPPSLTHLSLNPSADPVLQASISSLAVRCSKLSSLTIGQCQALRDVLHTRADHLRALSLWANTATPGPVGKVPMFPSLKRISFYGSFSDEDVIGFLKACPVIETIDLFDCRSPLSEMSVNYALSTVKNLRCIVIPFLPGCTDTVRKAHHVAIKEKREEGSVQLWGSSGA